MAKKIAHKTFRLFKGFSLIEILVVITILGILTSIGFVSFTNAQQKGRDARRKKDMEAIKAALVAYYVDNGAYPPGPEDEDTYFRSDDTTEWIPGISTYLSKDIDDPRQSGTYTQQPPLIQWGTLIVNSNSTDGYLRYSSSSSPPDYIGTCSSDSGSTSMYVGKSSGWVDDRGYLTFNTASISDDATITGASIDLHGTAGPYNPTWRNLYLQFRNFDWGNSLECPPGGSTSGYDWGGINQQGIPDATVVGSGTVLTSFNWQFFTISANYINRTGNTSFMLTSADEANNNMTSITQGMSIYTANHSTSSNRPRLAVSYTVESPYATTCEQKFIYCYRVSADRSSFVLWSQVENSKDQSLITLPTAVCRQVNYGGGSFQDSFNYCVESPK